MHIQQGQLPGQMWDPALMNNPWGSRLHSVDTGWIVAGPSPNTPEDFNNIFLFIELGSLHKVIYMDYQMIPMDGNNDQAYEKFIVRYGINDKLMSTYTDRNNEVSVFCTSARLQAHQNIVDVHLTLLTLKSS